MEPIDTPIFNYFHFKLWFSFLLESRAILVMWRWGDRRCVELSSKYSKNSWYGIMDSYFSPSIVSKTHFQFKTSFSTLPLWTLHVSDLNLDSQSMSNGLNTLLHFEWYWCGSVWGKTHVFKIPQAKCTRRYNIVLKVVEYLLYSWRYSTWFAVCCFLPDCESINKLKWCDNWENYTVV